MLTRARQGRRKWRLIFTALEQMLQPSTTIGTEVAEADRFGIETTPLAASSVSEASQVPTPGSEQLGGPNQIAASQPSDTATTQEAAPELIEIWRPIRRGAHQRGTRRERSSRRRPTAEVKEMQASGPAASEMPAVEGGSKPLRKPRHAIAVERRFGFAKAAPERSPPAASPAFGMPIDGVPKERSLRVVRRGRDQAAEPSDRSAPFRLRRTATARAARRSTRSRPGAAGQIYQGKRGWSGVAGPRGGS